MTVSQRRSATIVTPSLLLLMWAAINVMDASLTFLHLGWGGSEGNPLLLIIQTNLGPVAMFAAKMTGALAIGLFLARSGMTRHLSGASAGMSIVVLYNSALVPVALLS